MAPTRMPLSTPLLAALENLGRKKAGQEVDWINIADARALTDLGLAQRTPAGWIITAAGAAALDARSAAPSSPPPADRH
jgi:hypothetical protein